MAHEPPSVTSIPIVDLSHEFSASQKPRLLTELRHALTAIGFLYITGHGISLDIVSTLEDLLPQFFDLPQEDKAQLALSNTPHFLGYSKVGAETTGGKADAREQLECGTTIDGDIEHARNPWDYLYGVNQFPSTLPHLKSAVEAYSKAMTTLGLRFLGLVAEALDIDPDILPSFLSRQHRLKLVHYPQFDPESSENQGVGPHKDSSGWLTFLLQAQPRSASVEMSQPSNDNCLQVLNSQGDWIPVPPVRGALVVNIGQPFEVITHGRCRATIHRVMSGPAERFSVPFFQGVRLDATKTGITKALQTWAARQGGGKHVDSAWLKSDVETWGEWQWTAKMKSHRDVAKIWYNGASE